MISPSIPTGTGSTWRHRSWDRYTRFYCRISINFLSIMNPISTGQTNHEFMKSKEPIKAEWFHFGCGLLLGIMLFAFTVIRMFLRDQVSYLALGLIALAILLLGFAAKRYGNTFWDWLMEYF